MKICFGGFGVFKGVGFAVVGGGFGGAIGAEFADFGEGGGEVGVVATEAADGAIEIEVALGLKGDVEGAGDFYIVEGGGFLGGEGIEDGAFGDLEAFDFGDDAGHLFDDAVFGGVLWGEIGDVLVDEDAEAVFAFAFEEKAFDEAFEADIFKLAGILG